MPGWIANWWELANNSKSRIHRPRQIYTGENERSYKKFKERG
jgi:citrate synthase